MGAYFRTDPSITARGIAPAFDPIAAMSRIANLRRLQQRGQFNQQQLERMERQRARRQAVRGAIGEGGTRADMLRRLQDVAPVAGLEYAEKFRQEDRAAAVEQRAAENQRLAKIQSDLDFIAQKAGPLKALEEGGVGRPPADLETMQVAYADSLKWLEDHDVDTSWMPKEYTPGLADQAIREGLTAKQQVTAAQQAAELAERKAAREKKVPGVHVPFSPAVEAQKRRLGRAGRRTATEIQIELYTKDPELYEQIFDRVGIRNERQMRLKIIEAAMRLSESVSGQVDEKVFAKKLAELSSLVGVSLENQGQPQVSKTATRQEVEAFAQSKGISYEEAARQLQAKGYTIQ